MMTQTAKNVSELTDQDVVSRILRGEKELYEILIRRNNRLLFRVIRGYITEREDAEDVMQDAYVLAYQKLHQYRGEAAFSTWLIRIGINEALKYLRLQKRKNKIESDTEIDDDYIIHDQKTPVMCIVQSEIRNKIEKAIDALPEKLRPIFIMREIEGLSVDQVAQALNLTISNVKVRFHRAKSILQESLIDLTDVGESFAFGNQHCDNMVARVMDRIAHLKPEDGNDEAI